MYKMKRHIYKPFAAVAVYVQIAPADDVACRACVGVAHTSDASTPVVLPLPRLSILSQRLDMLSRPWLAMLGMLAPLAERPSG